MEAKIQEGLKQKLLAEKDRIEKNLAQTETCKKDADREYETTFPELDRDQEENADEMEMYESTLATDESLENRTQKN